MGVYNSKKTPTQKSASAQKRVGRGAAGKTPANRRPSSTTAPPPKRGSAMMRRGSAATTMMAGAKKDKPSNAQWMRVARDLPADELFKCPGCDDFCKGLDAMRVHVSSDHFHYFPIECLLCQERVPAVDIPTFRVHCKELGHPRPYEAHARESYDMDNEEKLFNATKHAVTEKMRAEEDKEAGTTAD